MTLSHCGHIYFNTKTRLVVHLVTYIYKSNIHFNIWQDYIAVKDKSARYLPHSAAR